MTMDGVFSVQPWRGDIDIILQVSPNQVITVAAEAAHHQADPDRDGNGYHQSHHRNGSPAERVNYISRRHPSQNSPDSAQHRYSAAHDQPGRNGYQHSETCHDGKRSGKANHQGI